MSGLDTELPRRVAAWLAATGAFTSTTFVNHSAGALGQLRAGEGVPSNADVVVTAQVREFTGRWRVPPKPASGPAPLFPPLADCEGRIAVELQLLDAHTLRPLWSGPVAVAVAPADMTFTLRDETRHTLENKLAVATLLPFAEQVEVALRAALSAPAGR